MKHSCVVATVFLGACILCARNPPVAPAQAPATPPTATYARDIAPIARRTCAQCHYPGGSAPFALQTFHDFHKRSHQIAEVVKSGFMPPWRPDSHGEFVGERRLTPAEIDAFQRWDTNGAAEGSGQADTRRIAVGNGLGKPDVVLQPPAPYHVAASGPDIYRCFVLPTHFTTDRYISAAVMETDDIHGADHAIAYLDTYAQAKRHARESLEDGDRDPGYTVYGNRLGLLPSSVIGVWGTGSTPCRLPPGTGILIPKDADIVLEMHYKKTGKPEPDTPRIKLYFTHESVVQRVRVAPIGTPHLRIPAGATGFVAGGLRPVAEDISVIGVAPYMRRLGRAITLGIVAPSTERRALISVPNWDFDWIDAYTFRAPVHVPGGSLLTLSAAFDNSAANPYNPNQPPKLVTWGEQTTDETAEGFVFYTTDHEDLPGGNVLAGIPEQGAANTTAMKRILLGMFDRNHNGRFETAETRKMREFLKEQMPKTGRGMVM